VTRRDAAGRREHAPDRSSDLAGDEGANDERDERRGNHGD